jgi:Kef-type K+ transport system membrane component KefB
MAAGAHDIPELDREGLRGFAWQTGAALVVIFGIVLPWLAGFSWPVWPWVVGGALAAWGVVAPASLGPVYRGWMRFGLLLNRIVSPIVLGIVFYVVITPVSLFMKVIGRDPMQRGFDEHVSTYRVPSKPRSKEQMERPF